MANIDIPTPLVEREIAENTSSPLTNPLTLKTVDPGVAAELFPQSLRTMNEKTFLKKMGEDGFDIAETGARSPRILSS